MHCDNIQTLHPSYAYFISIDRDLTTEQKSMTKIFLQYHPRCGMILYFFIV